MIPAKRGEAIAMCFKSRTFCKWATEKFIYTLAPFGGSMVLRCENIESEDKGVQWTVTNAYVGVVNFADCLKLDVDDGLALQFILEPEEADE